MPLPTPPNRPLRWCFSSLGCPEASLDEVLELGERYAMDALELRMLGGGPDLPAYFREHFGEPAALAERLRGAGRPVVVLGTSLRLESNTPADREAMLAFVPWAEAAGVPYLRVFDGGSHSAEPDAAALDRVAAGLSWWRRQRREHGWDCRAIIETHWCMASTAACLALQDRLDEPADLLWDSHHTWHHAGDNPLDSWAQLRPHVRHIHIKDSIPIEGAEQPEHVLPGAGRFPLRPLLDRLSADGYAGCVSLEWEKAWHPQLPPLIEALDALEPYR